ncbi:hypothetical protein AMATHDRAFT_78532 [Amanita thiersii Skay4041]|uniref:GATA-type domain-containing protein n=1 Tax=Amanita thiersii Skay4041 TaxID=703135 RepID=A0A2A9P121_9AGAR|nr:hypothetical protein AMATHDRAFT_78532 [Amanita thiersii Skay4041]
MSSSSSAILATPKPPQTFEFTKRKRWADLLITELADAIIFILSPSREVLYCGNAVVELLGWRVLDLLDRDFLDLIPSSEDQLSFCSAFQYSIATNVELLSYIRFKANSSANYLPGYSDVLFELKGYPHFVDFPHIECKCFFLMARPYPSRNTAMLNTFLELKTQNECLQQRLARLKALLPPQPAVSPSNPMSTSIYATSTMQPQHALPEQDPAQASDSSTLYFPPSATPLDDSASGTRSIYDGTYYGSSKVYISSSQLDDDGEDNVKKKKLKKTHSSEQYVCITCGRTDSPEWRKGPLGPKTLCNACGLRWAKQMRKYDDPAEGSTNSSEVTVSLSSGSS